MQPTAEELARRRTGKLFQLVPKVLEANFQTSIPSVAHGNADTQSSKNLHAQVKNQAETEINPPPKPINPYTVDEFVPDDSDEEL